MGIETILLSVLCTVFIIEVIVFISLTLYAKKKEKEVYY